MKKFILICLISCKANAALDSYILQNQNPLDSFMKGMQQQQEMTRMNLENQQIALQNQKTLSSNDDPNALPAFNNEKAPINCRAYIQYTVNIYTQKTYPIDEIMDNLEQNCGVNGKLWDYKP